MRRAFLTPTVIGALAASLCVGSGQAAIPAELEVTISQLQIVGPGRVGFDVAIAGLRSDLAPTIEGTATVGGQTIHGLPHPVVAARIPAAIDLPAGKIRVGGDASVVEFTPLPPLEENTPLALEITVRQGLESATARRSGVLL